MVQYYLKDKKYKLKKYDKNGWERLYITLGYCDSAIEGNAF